METLWCTNCSEWQECESSWLTLRCIECGNEVEEEISGIEPMDFKEISSTSFSDGKAYNADDHDLDAEAEAEGESDDAAAGDDSAGDSDGDAGGGDAGGDGL